MPFRNWDGDFVVFNPDSGNTHILDILSGEVLVGLFAAPSDEDAIAERMAAFLDIPADAGFAARIRQILGALEELALIEADTAC